MYFNVHTVLENIAIKILGGRSSRKIPKKSCFPHWLLLHGMCPGHGFASTPSIIGKVSVSARGVAVACGSAYVFL